MSQITGIKAKVNNIIKITLPILREPCLSRPHSPEVEEDEVTEAEGIDVDDTEGGDFDEEEAAGDSDVGDFGGGT